MFTRSLTMNAADNTKWNVENASVLADPPSGHSRGKLKRKRAILDAARDIMARSGDAGLTMLAVAHQAGVSPATPYNLFGSKQAILRALYEEDLRDFYRLFDERASDQPLDRLFDLVDLSIVHWQRAPDYYKALLTVLHRNSCCDVGAAAWSPRRAYVRKQVSDLAGSGALGSDPPTELLGAAMIRLFKAIGQEWIDGELSFEGMRRELGLSFAMILSGLVAPPYQPALAERRRRYELATARSGEV